MTKANQEQRIRSLKEETFSCSHKDGINCWRSNAWDAQKPQMMVRILMHRPHSVSGINQQTNFFHPLLKMRWACLHLLFRSMQKYQNSLIHSLGSDPALQVFIAVLFVEAEMFVTSRRTGLLISITFVHLQKRVPCMSVQEQVQWLWYKKTRKYFEFYMLDLWNKTSGNVLKLKKQN